LKPGRTDYYVHNMTEEARGRGRWGCSREKRIRGGRMRTG
jgi:hypothetical protein